MRLGQTLFIASFRVSNQPPGPSLEDLPASHAVLRAHIAPPYCHCFYCFLMHTTIFYAPQQNILWIVVEDSDVKTDAVAYVLRQSGVSFAHLNVKEQRTTTSQYI